jgi:hypothetical protein
MRDKIRSLYRHLESIRPAAGNQLVYPTVDQSTASPAYQLIPVT